MFKILARTVLFISMLFGSYYAEAKSTHAYLVKRQFPIHLDASLVNRRLNHGPMKQIVLSRCASRYGSSGCEIPLTDERRLERGIGSDKTYGPVAGTFDGLEFTAEIKEGVVRDDEMGRGRSSGAWRLYIKTPTFTKYTQQTLSDVYRELIEKQDWAFPVYVPNYALEHPPTGVVNTWE